MLMNFLRYFEFQAQVICTLTLADLFHPIGIDLVV
jgi:hypothetical protein